MNHVDYYPAADKPYILTTSDDRTIKVWDYTTKSLIATLEGHTSNVSFACFHPELPVIISGSEDATVKIWHANTYRLEQTLSYGLERAWCVSYQRGKNALAIGFDEGCVVVKMGREEPAVSMDPSGKIIWAKHNEVLSAAIKPSGKSSELMKAIEVLTAIHRHRHKGQRAAIPPNERPGIVRNLPTVSHAFTERPFRIGVR